MPIAKKYKKYNYYIFSQHIIQNIIHYNKMNKSYYTKLL